MTLTTFARSAVAALVLAFASPALADGTPAPEGAAVYFITPEAGATVSSPVTVRFGLSGMGVAPAGTEKENTGHHHLLIDRPAFAEAEAAEGIPADDNHRHFGGGQTEVTIELAPGTHSLQLVLGDQNHIPHNPPVVSDRIEITVK